MSINVGYSGSHCIRCEAGTYKQASGSDAYYNCSPFSTTACTASDGLSDCQCAPGYTAESAAACTKCVSSICVFSDQYFYAAIFTRPAGTETVGGAGGTPEGINFQDNEYIMKSLIVNSLVIGRTIWGAQYQFKHRWGESTRFLEQNILQTIAAPSRRGQQKLERL